MVILALVLVMGAITIYTLTFDDWATFKSEHIDIHDDLDRSYAAYCVKYEKSYASKQEYELRRNLYRMRLKEVIEESIIQKSFEIGENQFFDFTEQEIDHMLMAEQTGEENAEEDLVWSKEESLLDAYDEISAHEADSQHPIVMKPKLPEQVDWRKPVM